VERQTYVPLPAKDFDAATFGYFALRCVGRRLLGLEPALAIRFDSSLFARSNCARRVGLSPLPARLIKYVNILIPEPGPFGDTLRDAKARAIVLAAFVNKPACGCVESVLTFAIHRRPEARASLREPAFRCLCIYPRVPIRSTDLLFYNVLKASPASASENRALTVTAPIALAALPAHLESACTTSISC